MNIKLSKSDWESIGAKMGWLKEASGAPGAFGIAGPWNSGSAASSRKDEYHNVQNLPRELAKKIMNGDGGSGEIVSAIEGGRIVDAIKMIVPLVEEEVDRIEKKLGLLNHSSDGDIVSLAEDTIEEIERIIGHAK